MSTTDEPRSVDRGGVGKQFDFHAAHFDNQANEDDQCARVHGHTYVLEVQALGHFDPARGMILHGDVLKEIYRTKVEPYVEHRNLNEVLPFNPTMENMTSWILQQYQKALRGFPAVHEVEVILWETRTMYCRMRGGAF